MQKSFAVRKSVFGLAIISALLAPAASRAALVAAWGGAYSGQDVIPRDLTDAKAVACGGYHNLALRADGSVITWAPGNAQGQTNTPAQLLARAIAGGGYHSLALKLDGTVAAWGYNYYGQINVPASLANVSMISAGHLHSLALKADGTVVAWGDGSYRQTNVPAGLSNVIAIAAGGYDNLALKGDGTVVAWGHNGSANVPAGLSNVIALATSGSHSLALKTDGTIVGWGENGYGQATPPAGLSNITAIAVAEGRSVALRADGTALGWGYNAFGPTNVPPGLSKITAIAAGYHHNLALAYDGPIQIFTQPKSQDATYTSNATFSVVAAGAESLSYQWFFNGTPISSTNLRASGFSNHTLTITNLQFSDIGTYAVVVSNDFGSVISSGASLVVISPPFITQSPADRTVRAGSDVTLLAGASGTPPLWYQWSQNGTNLPGATNTTLSLLNVQPMASGGYTLNITNVYGFAQTFPMTLTVTDGPPFVLRQPTNQVVPIHGGVTFGLDARGSSPLSYQWAFNGVDIPDATSATLVLTNLRDDQIGYYNVEVSNPFGTTNSAKAFLNVSQVLVTGAPFAGNTNLPVALSNIIAVAAGGSHVMALKSDGTVRTWLANPGYIFDQANAVTNVSGSVTNVIAIAAGRSHCLALRSNGTVVAWGTSASGQTNVPAGLSNVIAIAAGWYRSYAVKSDGRVLGWGSDPGVPVSLSNVVAVAAGPSQNLALKRDGTITAWGSGSLANVLPGLSNVIAIAAGSTFNLALRENGTIVTWSSPAAAPPQVFNTVSNCVALSVGSGVGMALMQDGTLVSSGFERTTTVATANNLVAIAVGGVQVGFGVTVSGLGAPAITLQPVSQSAHKGDMVRLHARAAGVQPMGYQWQLENQNVPGATNASLLITNAQGKDTGGYRMIISNSLGTATSRSAVLVIPYNTNLAASLNTNNWQWSGSEGNLKWFAQIRETHDGDVAAQSGAIGNNQQSTLQTSITGPGSLTFWWKVSSEAGFDFLRFHLDNATTPLASISGENDWEQRTIRIPTGTHSLRWIYSKDVSVSAGRDAGWLDEVVFIPDPPTVSVQPTNQFAPMGTTVTFFAVVNSSTKPVLFQWLKGGTNLVGATNQTLSLTGVGRRDSATYAVLASNAGGSVSSSNAVLKVIVPQRLQPLFRFTDGSWLVTSGDADGGALVPEDLAAFEIQASTNLVNWITVPGLPALTNGSLQVRDSTSTNLPVRFYRMVEH